MNPTLIAALVALLLAPPRLGAESPFIAGLARDPAAAPSFAGTVLVSELACTACHASGQPAFTAKPGPDLSAVGARVNLEHLRRFLADPSGVKPGTTMPDVLGHLPPPSRDETATALAQYLSTLGTPETAAAPAPEAAERGRALYHSVGCVACHSPEEALPGSVPLGALGAKYTLSSLTAFLKDPLAVRPGGRMPDLHLDHGEAEDIASYLLREPGPARPTLAPDPALAARGRQLFIEHRCHACHQTGEPVPPPALAALNRLRPDEGCLSERRGAWPGFSLSAAQRTAVQAALAEETRTWSPAERTALTMAQLNCLACHERDGRGGVADERSRYFTGREESLGEQGRLPPALSGVGAKLKAGWLRDVIASGAGVRTTLNTRMPRFGGAHAEALVTWLKQTDSLPPATFERVPRADNPHQIGRELAGAKGLNCIACHTFRGVAAAIRGPELTTMTERLEEDWFHHFLAQPQRFAPLTVMPGFWPDGKSALPGVLNGDPGRQRDALWQFLAQGPEAGEPAGLVLEPLVVEVKDEAVIVRRAFPGVGKRGLGVGYPGGINLVFDAAQMRLASLWTGGFLEASGLWRGQGAGQARLLGENILNLPAGPAFAMLATPDAAWPAPDTTPRPSPFAFQGYTLDERRRPTLRYTVEGVAVEDGFIERRDAAGKLYLERTLAFPAPPPDGFHFRLAADASIVARDDRTFALGANWLVRLSVAPRLRDTEGRPELLLPVRDRLVIEYHPVEKP